jgi:hypothetical protein
MNNLIYISGVGRGILIKDLRTAGLPVITSIYHWHHENLKMARENPDKLVIGLDIASDAENVILLGAPDNSIACVNLLRIRSECRDYRVRRVAEWLKGLQS